MDSAGVRFGSFQLELRETKRADRPHVGRYYAALRDVNRRGVSWSFEAGDTYFTRGLGEYGFSNLTTPAVTLNGGAITARHARGTLQIVGGNAAAWRNIFGTDPDTLGQTLGLVRGAYKVSDRLEVLSRISRIQTWNLAEFGFSIVDSKQAGAGVRVALSPSIQLIGDGSYLQYRRVDSPIHVADGSFLTGASFLLPRGWIQMNVARFSPGDFPAMNDAMHDRESAFAAGDTTCGHGRRCLAAGRRSPRTSIPIPACPPLRTCRATRQPAASEVSGCGCTRNPT